MASGKAVMGALLKWTLVLAFGATLGGYIVFIYHDTPPPTRLKADDASEITPGSDSTTPTVASAAPLQTSEHVTADTHIADHGTPDPPDPNATPAPDGVTGPDVDIDVKPVPTPLPPRHYRKKKPVVKPKPPVTIPDPAETVPPASGTAAGSGTDGGGAGGADTGGTAGTTGGTNGAP